MTEVKGIKVIVDYCHNAPAMIALGEFVDRFFEDTASWERPQRIGVIATAGDRRDQDMIDLGLEAAKHFDRIIVREDERLRGRAPGETAALIVQGRAGRGRPRAAGSSRSMWCSTRSRPPRSRSSGPIPGTWCWSASTGPGRSGTSCR